ncbi:MAG: hypothetical protein WCF57_20135 [Pyrinomonadaceae bacterium]
MDKRIVVQTVVLQSCSVRVEASTEEECISEISFFQSLPAECPICQERLIFSHRKPTAKAEYYGLRCLNPKEPHETNFGDSQRFPGSLYYKGDHTFKPVPGASLSENGSDVGGGARPVPAEQFVTTRPRGSGALDRHAHSPNTINIDDPTVPAPQLRTELCRLIQTEAGNLHYIKLKGVRQVFNSDLLTKIVNTKYKVTGGLDALSPGYLRETYNWIKEEREKEEKREAITAELAAQGMELSSFAKEIVAKHGGRELDDLTLDELIVEHDRLLTEAIPF